MKKRYLIAMTLAGALAGAGLTINSCETTPKYVTEFCSLYPGAEDDAFQKEIFHSARDQKPIPQRTLEEIATYFSCSNENARRYSEKQRNVYSCILKEIKQEESTPKITRLLQIPKEGLNYRDPLVRLADSIDELKDANLQIDAANKALDARYAEVRDNVLNGMFSRAYIGSDTLGKRLTNALIWARSLVN